MNRITLLRRGMASAAAMVRPPIAVFGMDGRYANALYSAASKTKKLTEVEGDMAKLGDLCQKDRKFREFLSNPLISANQKQAVLKEVMTTKVKVCDITLNLLGCMAENNRLKVLPALTETFKRIMAATRGEIACRVITAKPITDAAVKSEIEGALRGFTKSKLTITMDVDPSIIGGMVVDFNGENYIDLSVRSRLKTYTDLVRMPV